MRKQLTAITVLTALAFSIFLTHSPGSAAMTGGTLLTTRQERTGIFEMYAYDGSIRRGLCTATVVSSSVATSRTWLVTAAHCFSYINSVKAVTSHFANPKASVIFERDADTSGTAEAATDPANSTVIVWPEWLVHSGQDSWYGPSDVALIRVNQAIPIFDQDGVRIAEFRRPIYTGPAFQVSEPYIAPSMKIFSKNAFCGQSGGELRCDTLSNLWWSPNFRNDFFQLPKGAWENAGYFVPGDDGGPLLKYAPGLTRQWDGAGAVLDVAMYGAVLGVLQGQTVWCDYIQNANCNPKDGLASRFEGMGGWIQSFAGDAIPQISMWGGFAPKFTAAVGDSGKLVSASQNFYSFPAYAGRIVGVAINKFTNQVHTWYDNGFMTVGTRSDLDSFSQASGPAPIPDVMPTRSFSGAPYKSHSQIVAMTMDWSGNVFTYYDDGTYVRGTATDLDAFQTPQPYALRDKAPRDLVGVASQSDGSVLAYYRDGTVSRGLFANLGMFGLPKAFEIGNGRGPEEILGLDFYNNGQMLTLFEHPRL